MTVAVLVPWLPGDPYREKAWEWVQARYAEHHPDWELVTGTTDVEGFSRTQAILDAIAKTDADTLVIADADVWSDGTAEAVDKVDYHGWAIPHLLIHRLSEAATLRVEGGADWRGQQLSTDNTQDSEPYLGHETDTLMVIRRDILLNVPPDPRFVGWGQEGDAWALALHTLIGKPWRGDADLVHLWHPPQPRKTRAIGNDASVELLRLYRNASRSPALMLELIEEGQCPQTSTSTTRASAKS